MPTNMKQTIFHLFVALFCIAPLKADEVPVDLVPVDLVPVDLVPVDLVPVDLVPVDLVPVDLVPVDLVPVSADSVVQYVQSCRKPNGAFGPLDQEYTDAAWNYPAVQTLLIMGAQIDRPADIMKHGLGFPSGHGGYGHWLFFHQQMTRKLLSKGGVLQEKGVLQSKKLKLVHQGYQALYYGSPFGSDGNLMYQASESSLAAHLDRAEHLQYYNLSSLYYLLAAVDAAGLTVSNPDELATYIKARQASSGGFVDVRVENRKPTDFEAHIAHTYHAIAALKLLSSEIPNAKKCGGFVHRCQTPSGAFRWNGVEGLAGNYDDIYYTWAAVQTLNKLNIRPQNIERCVSWINSLQNADGGFGDKPGWRSRLYSTYYATASLKVLCNDAKLGIQSKKIAPPKIESIDDGKFEIFQGLNKMPVCTVAELAELRRRKFNLLALKSSDFSVTKALRESILATKQPLDVILCPEAYSHRAIRHGGVTLDHIANVTLDPRWSDEEKFKWLTADRLGASHLTWQAYQRQVIRPVQQLGSLVYPEHEFEMEYGYSAYDDGVYNKHGYNAILAGFNWQPRDFVRVFPWRERYVDKLTPIADADAHGDLKKWSPQLDHTRHLYLAKGPTYADFLDAASNGRVVCVVYGAEGVRSGVTYYGRQAAVEFVKQRVDEWKWWPAAEADSD
ncbi:MAG: prenyltransferase beta subunit [Pirellulaceae bacterium]|jgi:prenyltransferase beta subunit